MVCILLVLVVLVQNPKGGGISSALSSTSQVMGVKKTADFLEKATWTLAISLMALSLLSAMIDTPNKSVEAESEIKEQVENEPVQPMPQMPANPAPAPQQQPAPQP